MYIRLRSFDLLCACDLDLELEPDDLDTRP